MTGYCVGYLGKQGVGFVERQDLKGDAKVVIMGGTRTGCVEWLGGDTLVQ